MEFDEMNGKNVYISTHCFSVLRISTQSMRILGQFFAQTLEEKGVESERMNVLLSIQHTNTKKEKFRSNYIVRWIDSSVRQNCSMSRECPLLFRDIRFAEMSAKMSCPMKRGVHCKQVQDLIASRRSIYHPFQRPEDLMLSRFCVLYAKQ